jgi:hypothetical protein
MSSVKVLLEASKTASSARSISLVIAGFSEIFQLYYYGLAAYLTRYSILIKKFSNFFF